MRKVDLTAYVLVIVGALNWGLVALAEWDLVAAIFGKDFGATTALSRIVYGLVGASGVWLAVRARAFFGQPAAVSQQARVTAPVG